MSYLIRLSLTERLTKRQLHMSIPLQRNWSIHHFFTMEINISQLRQTGIYNHKDTTVTLGNKAD